MARKDRKQSTKQKPEMVESNEEQVEQSSNVTEDTNTTVESVIETKDESSQPSDVVDETEEINSNEDKPVDNQPLMEKTPPVDNKPSDVNEKSNPFTKASAIISRTDLDFDDKIKMLNEIDGGGIGMLVANLASYHMIMSGEKYPPSESTGASKNQQLFSIIKLILNTKDKQQFKVRMDILNLFLREKSDSSFYYYNLLRFDYKWTNTNDLKQYNGFIRILTLAASNKDKDKLDHNKIVDAIGADKHLKIKNYYNL